MSKANLNIKSLVAGIIIGAGMMSSVSVFANLPTVTAWLQGHRVKIYVDGDRVVLDEDTDILNYMGRTYTPVRAVAEAMGGTVEWEEARQAVIITTPEPGVIEVEKENDDNEDAEDDKKKDKDEDEAKDDVVKYHEPPVRIIKNDVKINIVDYNRYGQYIDIIFDLESNSYDSFMLVDNEVYLEVNNKKYYQDRNFFPWVNSIGYDDSYEDEQFSFAEIPEEFDVATLVIPLEFYNRGNKEYVEFVFNLDISEFN